ncbi:deoxyribodipyrimidine photo-lyase [Caulobacter sp. 17J80-11]|uniref:cryptochrome/photolyase family protein n=1 Tax=Caulobacter sp. 17J80-11 TaxID=2763502 RepID=UPI0016538486|nr:deoxyribodipyrimidine photo-lyase [Caulobacter sp. 17J80-11]MBC6980868.1 deoxyribodipyrimidine photo-lyase [Caulobacter sp. 17J80-11]
MGGSDAAPAIVWFRRDLRLADNPALAAALATGAPVLPLYVFDEALEGRPIGGAARWWLDRSLRALDVELRAKGSRLTVRCGEARAELIRLVEETGARAVFWNRLPEPAPTERDAALRDELNRGGVGGAEFDAALLAPPGSILTGAGGPYRVFTPFARALRSSLPAFRPIAAPKRLSVPQAWPESLGVDDLALYSGRPDWAAGFDWTPGEAGAHARLDDFLDHGLAGYVRGRDTPGEDGTSRLSPHLHWGEISPARVYAAAGGAAAASGAEGAADKLQSELAWREFCAQLLHHFPTLPARSFRPEFDAFPWREDPDGFAAWSEGRTGYPIVDAGMRQLWATGWMHNRVRMIVASFLVKDLRIDWRKGEAWFWDTLVDADQANNAANWQWVAGSGADAAPYFRVFNPVLQGRKFDADGAYVRRWVPELADLPDRWLHAPWEAPAEIRDRSGGYPNPVVDHGAARRAALEALKTLRLEPDPAT